MRQFLFEDVWFEKYVSYNNYEKKFVFKNKQVKNEKLLSNLKKYKEKKLQKFLIKSKYFEKICKFIKKNGGIFLLLIMGILKKIQILHYKQFIIISILMY